MCLPVPFRLSLFLLRENDAMVLLGQQGESEINRERFMVKCHNTKQSGRFAIYDLKALLLGFS